MEDDLIRVAILAPSLAVRVGLRTLFSADEAIDIIAEAAEVADLEDDILVDVIVIQGDFGFAGAEFFPGAESQPALLWIGDDLQAARTLRGLPLRAWGILSTDASEDELIAAIYAIDQGLIVAPQRILEPLWADPPITQSDKLIEQLTPRESEVLGLLAQGLPNKQIALELEISEHTVKFHISSIYTKLNATNRTEAVRLGLRLGLIAL
jgi:DNA-binding NarL/FixJ family response regulator